MKLARLLIALSALALAGCSTESHTRTLTERERDSLIARSVLPGAGVVGRALKESDKATEHADDVARMDSLFH